MFLIQYDTDKFVNAEKIDAIWRTEGEEAAFTVTGDSSALYVGKAYEKNFLYQVNSINQNASADVRALER